MSEKADPGAIWKNQPEERLTVNLEQILKTRTEELDSVTRSEIRMSIGAALLFVAVMVWRLGPYHDQVLVVAYAVAMLWVVISLYVFRRRIWRRSSPPDAKAATGLEYYRKELEQRRDHLKRGWLWHGPLLLACLMLFAVLTGSTFSGYQRLANVLPLVALLVAWTAFGFWRRRGQAKEVQREIDEM